MIRNLNKWLIIAIFAIIVSGMVLTLWTVQQEENFLREESPHKNPSYSRECQSRARKSLTRY